MLTLNKNQHKTGSKKAYYCIAYDLNILTKSYPITKFCSVLGGSQFFQKKETDTHPLEDAAHQMISYWNQHAESNFQRHCGSLHDAWLIMNMEHPNPSGICENPSHYLSILAIVLSLESCCCLRRLIPWITETSWVNICVLMLLAGFYEWY